jgi:hypothetical protein
MLGFFAESLREHIADKEKEQQYIQSLAEDLKIDIKTFAAQIKQEKQNLAMLDSVVAILDDPAGISTHGDDLYYFGRLGPRLRNLIVSNRTFEQLSNSGNFRLISRISVSNKIMSYYEKVAYIGQIETIYMQEFEGYKMVAANVFDPSALAGQEDVKGEIIKSHNNPSLQNNAGQFVKQLAVHAIYMNGSRRGIIAADEELLQSARELLDYLQKEYHLDN